ncbi:MAG: hypothetical protein U0165_10960 [Polyangiaceae bacterium]
MRGKLIAVFSLIVVIVGAISFVVVRALVGDLVANPDQARAEGSRASIAAAAQFQLFALNMERWLDEQANDPKCREPFLRDNAQARGGEATAQADRISTQAKSDFKNTPPSMILFVDAKGIGVGRDGSGLLRLEDVGAAHPLLVKTLAKGTTGADLWVDKARGEQMLVAFASIRNDKGVIGGLVMATPLDDGLLQRISDGTSGRPISLATVSADNVEIIAKSQSVTPALLGSLQAQKAEVKGAAGAQRPLTLKAPDGFLSAGVGLSGVGDTGRAALVAFAPISLTESLNTPVLPILAATGLGLVLVVIASFLLDTYYSRPILELEEGLLAIISGDSSRRFNIEHAEFGGLAHRINSLLNQLMDVQEDNTDDEGRPSVAPAASHFQEALSVDADALKSEPAEVYYPRLFSEYIAAKRANGDKVDHITEQAFVERIKANELDTSQRQGRPVRFKVERHEKEVRLVAVPLE